MQSAYCGPDQLEDPVDSAVLFLRNQMGLGPTCRRLVYRASNIIGSDGQPDVPYGSGTRKPDWSDQIRGALRVIGSMTEIAAARPFGSHGGCPVANPGNDTFGMIWSGLWDSLSVTGWVGLEDDASGGGRAAGLGLHGGAATFRLLAGVNSSFTNVDTGVAMTTTRREFAFWGNGAAFKAYIDRALCAQMAIPSALRDNWNVMAAPAVCVHAAGVGVGFHLDWMAVVLPG